MLQGTGTEQVNLEAWVQFSPVIHASQHDIGNVVRVPVRPDDVRDFVFRTSLLLSTKPALVGLYGRWLRFVEKKIAQRCSAEKQKNAQQRKVGDHLSWPSQSVET